MPDVPVPASVDVAVIGAGLGGLMAAARLAQVGRSVVVFDAQPVAGGRAIHAHGRIPEGPLQFDVGLHYLAGGVGPSSHVAMLLDRLGLAVDLVPLDDDLDHLVFPDGSFSIPTGRERFRERLIEAFPSETRGIDRYTRLLDEMDQLMHFLGRRGARGEHEVGLLPLIWQVLAHGRHLPAIRSATIGEVVHGMTDHPRLRAVLLAQTASYAVAPSRASALFHLGVQAQYLRGATYPRGGGQRIADAVVGAIEAAGGAVCLGQRVTSIRVRDGRACGVAVLGPDGPYEVASRAVVSDADLPSTLTELLPEVPPSVDPSRFVMGGALSTTDLCVRADLREAGLGPCNTWLIDQPDYEVIYSSVAAGGLLPQAMFLSSASLKDPTTAYAPEGFMVLQAIALAPSEPRAWGVAPEDVQNGRFEDSPAYQARKTRLEDAVIDRIERAFPSLAGTVVYRQTSTPLSHMCFAGATGGTPFGLAVTPAQFQGGRPAHRGPVPGLYLAGSSTRTGPGIGSVMASGLAAAARLLEDA